ncbi:MAG: SDH family Clp fold serine proteinase [Phycisphaerales bacterium]
MKNFGVEMLRVFASAWLRRGIALLALAMLLALPQTGRGVEATSGTASPSAAPSTAAATTPTAATSLSAAAPIPAFRQAQNLAVITIEGAINGITSLSFKRRLDAALAAGADAIVVELNTPGGEVTAVIEICKALKGCGKHTIAWIRPDAYSGGAIIALACKEIVVAPGATMGDAAPIAPGPLGLGWLQGLTRTERAKALSPVLVEIVDSARLNGYDEKLVQAFVTLDAELWMVEDTRNGRRHFVTKEEYRRLFGESPDRGNPVVPSLGDAQKADPVGSVEDEARQDQPLEAPTDEGTAFKPASPSISNAVINELNSEVTGLTQVSKRPDFAKEDKSHYRALGYATDGKTLLTIKEQTIKDFGLAVRTISTDDEIKQFTGATNLRRLDQSWSEDFASFLDVGGPIGLLYRGVLIVVFLIALFLELSMPGATIPSIVALGALLGLLAPSLLIGASSWWALAAILFGLVLILLELFILPGFGVPGILGLLLLLGGLVGTFAEAGELFPGSGRGGSDLSWAVSVVLLAFFAAGVGMFLFSKYTRSFPIAGRMVLMSPRPSDDGEGLLAAMAAEAPSDAPVKIGQFGMATTSLRPSGTAEFDGKLIDVVAEFGYIEKGTRVRVVSTSFRIGVEAAPDNAAGGSGDRTEGNA